MGVELFLLLAILLSKAQRVLSPASAASDATKKAQDAAAEANAAAQRGDHATAAEKHAEAAQHQATAQQATKAARTPPPWPQVLPAELPAFPSAAWKPASPVTSAMTTRAWQLLPQLWEHGEGTWKAEKTADRWVVYRAAQMGEKRGVVAYTTTQVAPTAAPAKSTASRAPAAPAPTPAPAPPAPVDEVFDPMTGLPVSNAPAQIIPASAPARAAPTMPTLKLGTPMMTGPSVVWLQQRLGLKADGKFGPGTKTAVIAFQSSHGLKADGIVGPATWKALGVGTGMAA